MGVWAFSLDDTNADSAVDCAQHNVVKTKTKYTVELLYPNMAVDQYGNQGFWTMVYNQGECWLLFLIPIYPF